MQITKETIVSIKKEISEALKKLKSKKKISEDEFYVLLGCNTLGDKKVSETLSAIVRIGWVDVIHLNKIRYYKINQDGLKMLNKISRKK